MPDRIGRVENETAASEKAALDDIFLIGPLAPHADRADADRLHPPERGHVVGGPRRARRHQRRARGWHIGFGDAHGATFVARMSAAISGILPKPRISLRSCGLL